LASSNQAVQTINPASIFLWDVESATQLTPPWEVPTSQGVYVAFNRAGDRVLSWDWAGHSRLWDAVTGRLLLTSQDQLGCRFNLDDTLIGPGIKGGKLSLSRVALGQELRALRRPAGLPGEPILHPVIGDRRVLAVHTPNRLNFFDLASGNELASISRPPGYA